MDVHPCYWSIKSHSIPFTIDGKKRCHRLSVSDFFNRISSSKFHDIPCFAMFCHVLPCFNQLYQLYSCYSQSASPCGKTSDRFVKRPSNLDARVPARPARSPWAVFSRFLWSGSLNWLENRNLWVWVKLWDSTEIFGLLEIVKCLI